VGVAASAASLPAKTIMIVTKIIMIKKLSRLILEIFG
jgi:hypothetical protein